MTIKNAMVYENNKFVCKDFSVPFSSIAPSFNNLFILPAFCDVHVHLREPGFHIKRQLKAAPWRQHTAVFRMCAVCQT